MNWFPLQSFNAAKLFGFLKVRNIHMYCICELHLCLYFLYRYAVYLSHQAKRNLSFIDQHRCGQYCTHAVQSGAGLVRSVVLLMHFGQESINHLKNICFITIVVPQKIKRIHIVRVAILFCWRHTECNLLDKQNSLKWCYVHWRQWSCVVDFTVIYSGCD